MVPENLGIKAILERAHLHIGARFRQLFAVARLIIDLGFVNGLRILFQIGIRHTTRIGNNQLDTNRTAAFIDIAEFVSSGKR